MGFIYRAGLRIKNFGERIRSGAVQRVGLALMDAAIDMRAGI